MAEYGAYNPYANPNQNPYPVHPNPNPPPFQNQPRPPPSAAPPAYQQPSYPQAPPQYQQQQLQQQYPPQQQYMQGPPPQQAPMCTCPNPMQAVERTVQKEGERKGQKFWCCAVGSTDRGGCGFFQWQDAKLRADSDAKRQKSGQPRGPDPILVSLMKQVAEMNQKLDQLLGMMTGQLNARPMSVGEALGEGNGN